MQRRPHNQHTCQLPAGRKKKLVLPLVSSDMRG
jgi:hypothetical protein